MFYQGEFFTFDVSPTGILSNIVGVFGSEYGWASFNDHWHYEHTILVPVPRDLVDFGIDTSQEDGTSLFKNGEIVFDALNNELVYASAAEPSLGGRYHGLSSHPAVLCGDVFEDYFDFDCKTGIFVLTAE